VSVRTPSVKMIKLLGKHAGNIQHFILDQKIDENRNQNVINCY